MHVVFCKADVDGSMAACSRDISSDDPSDEDVVEVPKHTKEKEKTVNKAKGNTRGPPLLLKRRKRRACSFVCTRTLV
jgi:hypothetical protein